MAFARREVRKRHFVTAANFCVHLMDLACESVWRKPFRHSVGIEKRPIDFLWRGAEYAVKSNSVC
jgi:hypothetical protein